MSCLHRDSRSSRPPDAARRSARRACTGRPGDVSQRRRLELSDLLRYAPGVQPAGSFPDWRIRPPTHRVERILLQPGDAVARPGRRQQPGRVPSPTVRNSRLESRGPPWHSKLPHQQTGHAADSSGLRASSPGTACCECRDEGIDPGRTRDELLVRSNRLRDIDEDPGGCVLVGGRHRGPCHRIGMAWPSSGRAWSGNRGSSKSGLPR